MDITPILAEGAQRITAYGDGLFRINQTEYNTHIILYPDKVEIWQNAQLDENTLVKRLSDIQDCEILLVGTGAKMQFILPTIRTSIKQTVGAGIEVMDTGAACRTYNILLAEGRKVVALLMLV